MMPKQQEKQQGNRERLESLRCRKNGSVLKMIQMLEMCCLIPLQWVMIHLVGLVLGKPPTPSEKHPRITSRRQRRERNKTSCYDSDFCNNDLARQIEAMVLLGESAFACNL